MIQIVHGDLAAADTEAVIRPSRADGMAINAVGLRLASAAGAPVMERITGQGELPVGTAVLAPSGGLPCAFLINVVLQSAEEPVTSHSVQRGLVNALRRAADFGIESLALPPLGVGAGNLEVEDSAKVIVDVIRNHLAEGVPPLAFRIVVDSEYEESVFAALVGGSGSRS